MSSILPPDKPEMTRDGAVALLAAAGSTATMAVIGRRGYYADSMGVAGKNDVGIYDDAIMLLTPDSFLTFNANTDPSRLYPDVAILKAGIWTYKLGIHNLSKPSPPHERYLALVQAAPVTVQRYGGHEDTGYFGINIHKGGYNVTSSEGCQTVYPDQWPDFIAAVRAVFATYAITTIPYVLTERGV